MLKVVSLFFVLTIFACKSPVPECTSDTSDDLNSFNQMMLAQALEGKDPQTYRYFFKTFIKEDQDEYMVTNFRNKVTCFDVKVLVNKWDKLAGMKRSNGQSYPKELRGLRWKVIDHKGTKVVSYVDMLAIMD